MKTISFVIPQTPEELKEQIRESEHQFATGDYLTAEECDRRMAAYKQKFSVAAFERVAHIHETWKKHVQDLLNKSNQS